MLSSGVSLYNLNLPDHPLLWLLLSIEFNSELFVFSHLRLFNLENSQSPATLRDKDCVQNRLLQEFFVWFKSGDLVCIYLFCSSLFCCQFRWTLSLKLWGGGGAYKMEMQYDEIQTVCVPSVGHAGGLFPHQEWGMFIYCRVHYFVLPFSLNLSSHFLSHFTQFAPFSPASPSLSPLFPAASPFLSDFRPGSSFPFTNSFSSV